jgi:prephenate dehydrogenase
VNIAVVGAAGNMGRWFTNYFIKGGHRVKVYDKRRKDAEALAKEVGAEYTPTLKKCLRNSEVIFLSIPIEATPQMVAKIGRSVENSVVLVEISSLKSPVIPALRRLPRHITPLSLHPLFGPGLSDLKFGRIIVVEVSNVDREAELAQRLLPEASFVKCGVEEHDKMIAYSLTLPYFMNLAFGLSLSDVDMAKLRRFAGTTLTVQLDLLEAIIQSSRNLISTVMVKNPYSRELINQYLKAAEKLNQYVKKRIGLGKVVSRLEKKLSSDQAYSKAYQNIYRLAEEPLRR